MKKAIIRPATESDSPELARLTAQLGYPSTVEEIRERVSKILGSPNDILLVAEVSAGELAGWIHGFLCQHLESDYRAEIAG